MADRDAFAQIRTLLRRYGLGSLANWAWQLIQKDRSPAEIEIELFDRPEFRERFSAIFERERLGLAPLSPNEVIEYENTVRQMSRMFNIPQDFLDQDFLNRLIVADVSAVEAQQRMQLFASAAFEVPQDVRAELSRLYNVGEGELAAFFMNPDRGRQIIERQFMASQLAGAARRSGFEQLTREEAETLSPLVSLEAAEERFGVLQRAQELFQPLPGTQEQAITRQQQLGFVGADVEAQRLLERRARGRLATFEAGGQFATTEAGITGLGRAQT